MLEHPDRLDQPLVRDRRDAPLRATTWDDVLDRVALGTSQIDYNGRFCMSWAAAATTRAFGIDRGRIP